MTAFYGVRRRFFFTGCTTLLFCVGWSIYLIGLIVLALQTQRSDCGLSLTPWILILFAAGAPCSFVAQLCDYGVSIHPVIQFFSTLLGVLFNVSIGAMLVGYYTIPEFNGTFARCIITGSVICIHCWCINLTLSIYKENTLKPDKIPCNRLFHGCARKLAIIPSILLIFGGVLVLLYSPALGDIWISRRFFWLHLFFGLSTVILILSHAGSWGVTSIVIGLVSSYMVTTYTVCMGYVFFVCLNYLLFSSQFESPSMFLMFTGSLLSIFAMVFVLLLWPYYTKYELDTDNKTQDTDAICILALEQNTSKGTN